MTFEDLADMLGSVNIYVLYGVPAALTVGLILYRNGLLRMPRLLALAVWYAIIVTALFWLVFHMVYFATHNPRDSGMATLANILSFIPVYVCALIAAFVYPRKGRQHDIPT